MNHDQNSIISNITRRYFFKESGIGLGKIALASLLTGQLKSTPAMAKPIENPLASKEPHFKPRAKNVIFLFMTGAPSQPDLFDYKPALEKHHGQAPPQEIVSKLRLAFAQHSAKLLGPQYKFEKCGESGAELSEVVPYLKKIADEITIIKSMHTDHFNHAPAQIFLNTGSGLPGRPSMGSWVSYGLGSEADDLPSYVVLSSGGGSSGGAANFSSGFLPTLYSGVPFRDQGPPIVNVANPNGVDKKLQRDSLDLIQKMNQHRFDIVGDPEIQSRMSAYETAFRMQSRAPELMDFSGESKETLAMYGADPKKPSFASQCLLARRLVERGVRFVNILLKGWDHHSGVKNGLKNMCRKVGSGFCGFGDGFETTWIT